MADVTKIKTPNGSVYDIRDDNAIPKAAEVPLTDSFSVSYPNMTDPDGLSIYREYYRKMSDSSLVDKIWRVFTTGGDKYSDLRATATATSVTWNFSGTASYSLKVNGKTVVVDGEQGTVYQTGTITNMSDGTAQSKSLTFTPTIVILYDLYGHVITGGFSITMGTKKFTITPSSISTIGNSTAKWVAFA